MKKIFQELLKESPVLKQEAWNCDHPNFSSWRERAKKAVAQFAPMKIPTFSEITFASDFYLSKAIEDRFEINDRIALVDDLNLAEKIFNEIIELLEKETSRKRFRALQENKVKALKKDFSEVLVHGRFSKILKKAKEMKFSLREIEEISLDSNSIVVEEAGNILENSGIAAITLHARTTKQGYTGKSNWDLIKRTIKFFLDYDTKLALFVLPLICSEYENNHVS